MRRARSRHHIVPTIEVAMKLQFSQIDDTSRTRSKIILNQNVRSKSLHGGEQRIDR